MSLKNEIKLERERFEKEKQQKAQQERIRRNNEREKYISFVYNRIKRGCITSAARGDYKTTGIFFKRKLVEYQSRIGDSHIEKDNTALLAANFFRKYPSEADEVVRRLAKDKIIINGHGYNEYLAKYYFNVRYYIED